LAYALRGGTVCRSWDDFLAVSAQRWDDLRAELISGRLGAQLALMGHHALVPDAEAPGTPDERLDAWLARLPTTRHYVPELQVHPTRLDARAEPEPGRTAKPPTLRVRNVGYRLLRGVARIEPDDADWLRFASGTRHEAILTVEETDLALEIDPPPRRALARARAGSTRIVLETNGGVVEVPVAIGAASPRSESRADWRSWPAFGALGAGTGALARLGAWGIERSLASGNGASLPAIDHDYRAAALVFLIAGTVAGLGFGWRSARPLDRLAGAIAGAIAGVLASDGFVVASRAIEPAFGSSPLVSVPLWAGLGALVSCLIGLAIGPWPETKR
jgi:hypothetical protein